MADEATTQEGADETSVDTGTDSATESQETHQGGEAALGDAGKKALDAMKADRNKARDEARRLREEFEAFKAKAEGREAEHRQALEAQRIKDEALAAANQRILSAEVRAQAAGKLNDPSDALAYIDLSSFEVGDDGAVDTNAIGSAITDLITKKPYLAAQGSRFQGSADGGARNDSTQPAQLTRSDMERMSPEQIDEAMNKGQFDRLLGRQ
jgi:hypothetical protein